MEKDDLTYRIIRCAMNVHNELGRGFMEYVCCRALAIELKHAGILFEREVWLPIHYKNFRIGFRRVDFVCADPTMRATVELKAKAQLEPQDLVQAKNTLERLNVKDGLLINFGGNSLEFKHIFNKNTRPETDFEDATPALVGETNDDLWQSRHYLPSWLVEKMQRERQIKQNNKLV
ncbi:MAG: GxxExxY protein [Saprospiraceae bacterium]|nr:GxxExxY protein [Saprospiraceae bacterium]